MINRNILQGKESNKEKLSLLTKI